jgi:hypothetical protein
LFFTLTKQPGFLLSEIRAAVYTNLLNINVIWKVRGEKVRGAGEKHASLRGTKQSLPR